MCGILSVKTNEPQGEIKICAVWKFFTQEVPSSAAGAPSSVVSVGALGVVHVTGQHVVVHVDGAAVVDGVAKALGHDGLAGVRRQAQLEEARL